LEDVNVVYEEVLAMPSSFVLVRAVVPAWINNQPRMNLFVGSRSLYTLEFPAFNVLVDGGAF
jgi:hypothetical protein